MGCVVLNIAWLADLLTELPFHLYIYPLNAKIILRLIMKKPLSQNVLHIYIEIGH